MTHEDIIHQIPDYVLGILPTRQISVVEQHIAHCTACRQAVTHERQLSRLVHSTLDMATTPDSVRLRNLMPAIRQKRNRSLLLPGWQKQLVPALLVIGLLFGGLLINNLLPAGSVPAFVATAHAATVTSTYTPTATTTETMLEAKRINITLGGIEVPAMPAIESRPAPPAEHPKLTPGPAPTPVASVRQALQ